MLMLYAIIIIFRLRAAAQAGVIWKRARARGKRSRQVRSESALALEACQRYGARSKKARAAQRGTDGAARAAYRRERACVTDSVRGARRCAAGRCFTPAEDRRSVRAWRRARDAAARYAR